MKRVHVSVLGVMSILALGHSALARPPAVSLSKPMVCVEVFYAPTGAKAGGAGPANVVVWSPLGKDYRRRHIVSTGKSDVSYTYLNKGTLSAYTTPLDYLFYFERGEPIDVALAGQPIMNPMTVEDDGSNEIQISPQLIHPFEIIANMGLKLDPETGIAKAYLSYEGSGFSSKSWFQLTCWNSRGQ